MAIEHVKPGSPFRPDAKAHNAFVDAYRYSQAASRSVSFGPLSDRWQSSIVLVRNDTGGDRIKGEVLGLETFVFDPVTAEESFTSYVSFAGRAPVATDYTDDIDGKWGVLLEPIADGAIGRACVSGMCVCDVDLVAVWHTRADIIGGDSGKLRSYPGGSAKILALDNAEVGIVKAYVRVGINPEAHLLGKLDGELAADGSATMSIWYNAAGTWTDTTNNTTVYASPLQGSITVASGKWVSARWHPQGLRLVLDSYEC